MTTPIKAVAPNVLYIDDDPGKSAALFKQVTRNVKIVDTTKPTSAAEFERLVKNSDIVVSDFVLDDNRGSTGAQSKGGFPTDGQVVNETVRSLRRIDPPIVAIYSAKLDSIPGAEDLADVPHHLARLLNATFVGDKKAPEELKQRLRSVVAAMRATFRLIHRGAPITENKLHALLKLPLKVEWKDEVLRSLELSRPPLRTIKNKAAARVADIFNWLARDILPYPGLFLDVHHLALALRVDPKWLDKKLIDNPTMLSKTPLAAARYNGILSDFMGDRWWTAGVDHIVWKATRGSGGDDPMSALATEYLGRSVMTLKQRSPVLLVDEYGRTSGKVVEANEAIRIMPVGWPTGGPWPWAAIKDVKSDSVLKTLALPDDLRSAGIA